MHDTLEHDAPHGLYSCTDAAPARDGISDQAPTPVLWASFPQLISIFVYFMHFVNSLQTSLRKQYHKLCRHPEGCTKHPLYGIKGSKLPLYCKLWVAPISSKHTTARTQGQHDVCLALRRFPRVLRMPPCFEYVAADFAFVPMQSQTLVARGRSFPPLRVGSCHLHTRPSLFPFDDCLLSTSGITHARMGMIFWPLCHAGLAHASSEIPKGTYSLTRQFAGTRQWGKARAPSSRRLDTRRASRSSASTTWSECTHCMHSLAAQRMDSLTLWHVRSMPDRLLGCVTSNPTRGSRFGGRGRSRHASRRLSTRREEPPATRQSMS